MSHSRTAFKYFSHVVVTLACGVLVSAAIFFLTGCKELLPTETIKWQPDGQGYLQYYTDSYWTHLRPENGVWAEYEWVREWRLNRGLGAVNTINITNTTNASFLRYMLAFNGEPHGYVDIPDSSGSCAFVVFIGDSDLEHFPNRPVDVRFRMRKPVVVP